MATVPKGWCEDCKAVCVFEEIGGRKFGLTYCTQCGSAWSSEKSLDTIAVQQAKSFVKREDAVIILKMLMHLESRLSDLEARVTEMKERGVA